MSTHLSQSTHMSQSESKCLEEQAVELVDKGELPKIKRKHSAGDVEHPEKKRKVIELVKEMANADPDWQWHQMGASGYWTHPHNTWQWHPRGSSGHWKWPTDE